MCVNLVGQDQNELHWVSIESYQIRLGSIVRLIRARVGPRGHFQVFVRYAGEFLAPKTTLVRSVHEKRTIDRAEL